MDYKLDFIDYSCGDGYDRSRFSIARSQNEEVGIIVGCLSKGFTVHDDKQPYSPFETMNIAKEFLENNYKLPVKERWNNYVTYRATLGLYTEPYPEDHGSGN